MAADLLLHARGRLQVRLARRLLTALASPVANAMLSGCRRGGTARDRTQIGAASRRRRLCRRTLPPCVTLSLAAVVLFYQAAGTLKRMGPHNLFKSKVIIILTSTVAQQLLIFFDFFSFISRYFSLITEGALSTNRWHQLILISISLTALITATLVPPTSS